jgi:hypothetical protein
MNQRVDEVAKYYEPIEDCEAWASVFFLSGAVLSIAALHADTVKIDGLDQILNILFLISVVLHSVLTHFSGFYLIPRAENIRRKQLISNSLDIPLTSEQTNLYYNNEVAPSLIRLGVNVLENSFFAKNVCNEMAKKQRIKVLVYFCLWFFAILYRDTELGLLLILTQILFSGDILIRWLKIELLRAKNESIYEKLYSLFLNKVDQENTKAIGSILDAFASYEAAKSSASIKQSTKIFKKINQKLTRDWSVIRERLGIENKDSNNTIHPTATVASIPSASGDG